MPNPRTPSRWPYRAAKPVRARRVVKAAKSDAPRGVRRKSEPIGGTFIITPGHARLALAMLLAAGLLSAAWWAYNSPYLTVRAVEVTGTNKLTQEQVRAASGLEGDSVFGLDLEQARENVAALPNVRNVTIEKHGWTGVTVHVEERTPWGSWQLNGTNVPIDIDGYVMDTPAAEGSPIIVEAEPQRVLNPGDRLDPGAIELAARLVAESERSFGRSVKALIYRQSAGLTVVFSGSYEYGGDPVWVTFGDSRDYDYKVAALYVLLEQAEQEDVALSAVDLRFGDRLSFN